MAPRVYIISGRRTRSGFKKAFKKILVLTLLLFFGWSAFLYLTEPRSLKIFPEKETKTVVSSRKSFKLPSLLSGEAVKKVFIEGLPAAAILNMDLNQGGHETDKVVKKAIDTLAQTNLEDPKDLIISQMGFLLPLGTKEQDEPERERMPNQSGSGSSQKSNTDQDVSQAAPESKPLGTEETQEAFAPDEKPLVGIYNTHNAENYYPGKEKLEGKNGGVSLVAETLSQVLEKKHGIKVVRSVTIHDYPKFELSYSLSAKTAREMLQNFPSLQAIIDVHRDAGLRAREVVKVDNKNVARILLVVGSNARLQHPNWKRNHEFAKKVAATLEKLYPGVSKGVRVQDGRYNQHLHPHSLLVEMGSAKNSLEEAQNAAALLADALAEVIRQDSKASKI